MRIIFLPAFRYVIRAGRAEALETFDDKECFAPTIVYVCMYVRA